MVFIHERYLSNFQIPRMNSQVLEDSSKSFRRDFTQFRLKHRSDCCTETIYYCRHNTIVRAQPDIFVEALSMNCHTGIITEKPETNTGEN